LNLEGLKGHYTLHQAATGSVHLMVCRTAKKKKKTHNWGKKTRIRVEDQELVTSEIKRKSREHTTKGMGIRKRNMVQRRNQTVSSFVLKIGLGAKLEYGKINTLGTCVFWERSILRKFGKKWRGKKRWEKLD